MQPSAVRGSTTREGRHRFLRGVVDPRHGEVLAFLADDCVYRMTETTAPANGHDGVIARLKSYVEGSIQLLVASSSCRPIFVFWLLSRLTKGESRRI
jgi:hypothetical protein